MNKNRHKSGFTLIEILITLSLATLTSMALMTSLIQGIKIFNRFSQMTQAEEKSFFIERFTRDLHNATEDSGIPWVVSQDKLVFASISGWPGDDSQEGGGLPAKVTYQYAAENKTLARIESLFPYMQANTHGQVVLTGVKSVTFDAFRDSEESLPQRVSVTLEVGQESEVASVRKTVMIPISYRES